MHYRSNLLPATVIICLAIGVGGCLPASRVAHSGNRSETDAAAIHSAQTRTDLGPDRRKVLIVAEGWLGTPYSYGGTSRSGTDCSGFVRSVFNEVRVSLPRTSSEQASVGSGVPLTVVEPGDLLFFNTTGGGVSHVGISIGEDKFIHASTSRGVIVSSLDEAYYRNRFLFARKVL